jgi:NADH dehydrogenase FAD-containing subunit
MQVGSVNNTFGVQGVREHCQFFKTIEDATRLRKRISECFERAALPNVSAAPLKCATKQLLSRAAAAVAACLVTASASASALSAQRCQT